MGSQDEAIRPQNPQALVIEAWAQGFMVGGLIIMASITAANMRKGVMLHKVICLELVLGLWQGFFIFFEPPIYAWWLSIAAIFLNTSWTLHNVVAWMKLRPFLSGRASLLFLSTLSLAQAYWVVEIYANFTFFHNINKVFLKTRPLESLFRDPWWVYAVIFLPYTITTKYDLTVWEMMTVSPRFAIMSIAMMLSVIFTIVDILSVTNVLQSALPVGINPFWKLSFVLKCLTDVVILDDFKTALDRIRDAHQRAFGARLDTSPSGHSPNFPQEQRRWHGQYVDQGEHKSRRKSDAFALASIQRTIDFEVAHVEDHH